MGRNMKEATSNQEDSEPKGLLLAWPRLYITIVDI